MTVYAPTDFVSVTIPEDRGGCGQPHGADRKNEAGHAMIDCEKCGPHIAALGHGFAHSPAGVHLTTDEIAEAESSEAQATRARNRTWGDPRVLGDAIADALHRSTTPAAAPSPAELVAAMSDDEKATLRALLADEPGAGKRAPRKSAAAE